MEPSKPRRPTRLICCTLAGGDKPHNCVWRSCKVGVCPSTSLEHGTRHGVKAANVNSSISSHSRDEAGSIRSNLSFQAFRILDDLTRAAVSNSARPLPQRTSPAPRTSSPQPDSQPATQSADTEALYIFSPRHESTACYLYQPKDSQPTDMYEVEHVPVEVVKDSGRLAYLIAVSDQDDIVDTLKFRSTSQETRAQPDPNIQTQKQDGSPHSSTDESGRGPGGAGLQVRQHQEHSSKGIGSSIIRVIVDRIKDQLQARGQRRTGVHIVNDTGKHAADGKSLYLVSDDDIAAAVKAAAADLGQTDASGWPSRSSSKVSSASSHSLSLPKLDSQLNAITPRLSAAVDPETTFSVPKPSFSSLGRADSRLYINKGLDVSTRATVISRQSVAGIIWTEEQHHGQESGSQGAAGTMSRVISNDSSPEDGPLAVQPPANTHLCQTEIDSTGCSPYQNSVPETLENLVADISFAKRGSQSTDELNITSFPELRPRHCTQEWLNPPVEMEQLTRPPSADLYQLGVDAHSGGVSQLPSGCLEEPINKTERCNHTFFQDDPFCYANIYPFERRATESSASISADRRLGAAIGSASRRRRSSQVPDSKPPQLDYEDGLLPSVFDRLRKRGEKMFHLHDCPEESDGSEAGMPTNSPADDRRPGAGPRSRDSLIRERTPQPPRPDTSGIYEAMTGSRRLSTRKRNDTCSEDNRPHVCEDDMDSTIWVASPA